MKKYLKVVLAFSTVISLAALASAEDINKEGTIGSVDTIANTFVLKTDSESISIYVRPMSHMRVDGESKPLAGLSGSEAKCKLFMKDGRLTVRECIVTPKK